MKRPAVEEFKRLTSKPASQWGMADSDVIELCDYILHLEAECFKLAAGVCEHRGSNEHGNPLCLKTNQPI